MHIQVILWVCCWVFFAKNQFDHFYGDFQLFSFRLQNFGARPHVFDSLGLKPKFGYLKLSLIMLMITTISLKPSETSIFWRTRCEAWGSRNGIRTYPVFYCAVHGNWCTDERSLGGWSHAALSCQPWQPLGLCVAHWICSWHFKANVGRRAHDLCDHLGCCFGAHHRTRSDFEEVHHREGRLSQVN